MSKLFIRIATLLIIMFSSNPLYASFGRSDAALKHANRSIVFIHIGPELPSYLPVAMKQARLFNDCEIVLVANKRTLLDYEALLTEEQIIGIATEYLPGSVSHRHFHNFSTLDRTTRGGFWLLASERFFFLEELMRMYNLKNVLHLESDVMLYSDLDDLVPLFNKYYRGIAGTFDNDERCIPGLIFFSTVRDAEKLVKLMAEKAPEAIDDMFMMGYLKKRYGEEVIDNLPIVGAEYIQLIPVKSQNAKKYCQYIDDFNSIFDAAYMGQYLGGVDPRNADIKFGFVNTDCVINSSYMQYIWEVDEKGRSIPYAQFGDKLLKINNLHIHSKRLHEFYSLGVI
ncbi:MAG: hypothetical protein S4CHLAM102_07480 [Chlamydiia bacterium]|nr:hypothetical protein [Chlamydiia bacterium]